MGRARTTEDLDIEDLEFEPEESSERASGWARTAAHPLDGAQVDEELDEERMSAVVGKPVRNTPSDEDWDAVVRALELVSIPIAALPSELRTDDAPHKVHAAPSCAAELELGDLELAELELSGLELAELEAERRFEESFVNSVARAGAADSPPALRDPELLDSEEAEPLLLERRSSHSPR